MNNEKKVFWGILIVVALIIVGTAWTISNNQTINYPNLEFAHANCSFNSNVSTANYSATIVAVNNYDSVVSAVKALVAKYNGEDLSWSTYDNQYQTGSIPNDNAEVTSTNISATISITDGDNFMNDLQGIMSTSDSLQSPSYSQTIGTQLIQNCIDDVNNTRQQQSLSKLYLEELPLAVKNYVPATTTNYGSGNSSLDDFSQQLQTSYSNLNSYNDSLASLMASLNKMTISLTIDTAEQPSVYYPPTSIITQSTPTND